MISIKAHFDGKAIIPDEPVELPQGRPLLVDVREASLPQPENGDGEKSVWEKLLSLAGTAHHLPPDAADQHDHYLYGTPKQ